MGLLLASLGILHAQESYAHLSDLPTLPHLPVKSRGFRFLWFTISSRTLFFATICLIIVFILAYLTNPSETSFRTFLTEQAFRRHLHKLSDSEGLEDETEDALGFNANKDKTKRYALPHHEVIKPGSQASVIKQGNGNTGTLRFHFTHRLAVSLQTPTHVFRSYGLCTIAVTQQVDTEKSYTTHSQVKRRRSSNSLKHFGHHNHDHHSHPLSVESRKSCATCKQNGKIDGTWYIGVFGRWWVGGELEFLKEDLLPTSSKALVHSSGNEEGSNSPELHPGGYDVKVLDHSDAYDGLPIRQRLHSIRTSVISAPSSTMASAKSRSRASTSSNVKQTATPLPSRGSTPPPNSRSIIAPVSHKSANATNTTHRKQDPSSPSSRKSRSNSNANPTASYLHNPVQSMSEGQSPDVTKLLGDISQAQRAAQELTDQLSSFQSQAFASQAALRLTLEEQRSRKKQEDSARAELKGRTKILEESKRHADTAKRDAEKKLKAAQGAKESATNRKQKLTSEIDSMKSGMKNNEVKLENSKDDLAKLEEQTVRETERQRSEIKTLEDSVSTLGSRVREMEDSLSGEKERLAKLRDELEQQRQQHQAALALAIQLQIANSTASNGILNTESTLNGVDPPEQVQAPLQANWAVNPAQPYSHNSSHSMDALGQPTAYIPNRPFASLDLPNGYIVPPRRPSAEVLPMVESLPTNGISSHRIRSLSLGELSNVSSAPSTGMITVDMTPENDAFSPFDVDDRVMLSHQKSGSLAPLDSATSLLPSNLVNSIETESPVGIGPSAALPSTDAPGSEARSESRWRSNMWPFRSDSLSKSQPSDKRSFDPFDAQLKPMSENDHAIQAEPLKQPPPAARKWFSRSVNGSITALPTLGSSILQQDNEAQTASAPEGTLPKSRSRLNPDAKVFSLPKGRSLLSSALWTPTGVTMPPPTNIRPGSLQFIPSADVGSSFASAASLPLSSPSEIANHNSADISNPASKLRFRGLFTSPFAPSPAEREALQRALNKNLSHDHLSIASDGSGGDATMRLPPSPFGLLEVDEEEAKAGWDTALNSATANGGAIGAAIARQTTR